MLALSALSCAHDEAYNDTSRPLDHLPSGTRHAIECLIAVLHGAETTLDASIGAGLTLRRADTAEAGSPLARALGATADEWIASEVARWATLGLSLSQLTVVLANQQSLKNPFVDLGQLRDIRKFHPLVNLMNGLVDVTHLDYLRAAGRNESSI